MDKIKNIEDLRNEINYLTQLASQQKLKVKDDLKQLTDGLKPANLIRNALSDITGIKMDKDEFVRNGFMRTVSLFTQRLIIKGEKKLEEVIYSVIDNLFDRIKHFVSSISDPEAKRKARSE